MGVPVMAALGTQSVVAVEPGGGEVDKGKQSEEPQMGFACVRGES